MSRWAVVAVGLTALALAGACGRPAAQAGHPSPAPSAHAVTPAPSPSSTAEPTATPSPAAAPGTAPPPPVPVTFTGTVVHPPGARIRSGPGVDQPVMDVEPVGLVETFDGWFRRLDDPPLPDEITGRIEAWSRDWLHLADGRGWAHSAAVRGFPPVGMPQRAWTRPDSPPAPTAGLIDVAVDAQDRNATCEVASLKMALGSRGIRTDEQSLLGLTSIDARPPEVNAKGGIARWGNPNQAFVGDPDGRAADYTGYGVYTAPIVTAAAGSGATVLASGTGIAPSAIYAAVLAGHPAITWVTSDYRRASLLTWQAWDGSEVKYALTEHAVLVVGVTPSLVLVNDPWWGQAWHSRSEFEAAYATFGDMAVIVG